MNHAMLMKPPSILDEIISQDSENFTNKSNARSAAAKRQKKENTIRIGANSQESKNQSKEHDNQSVHSNASAKSKGKKSKETTLARPKIMQSPKVQRQDDNHSVHSTGSRHSHKSAKKENTIMQRPKIEGGIKIRQEQVPNASASQKNQLSFKAAWNDQEESVIKGYEYRNQRSPQVINYNQKYEQKQRQQRQPTVKPNQPKFSPFAEIQHQYNSDDQPVIKLEQPAFNNNLVLGTNKNADKPKRIEEKKENIVENKPAIIESRLAVDQSNVIFGQSKLRQTKSRRRNIFEKTVQQNSSRVSNSIAESSVSGLEDTTRRKSKSRLRELFNNSREKKDRQDSQQGRDCKESANNMITIGAVPLESKQFNQSTLNRSNFKPAAGVNDKLVQLQQKVLDKDNDDFYLEQSKSDLNLSTSNNMGRGQYKDKDSLIFQFQPEKKKGMSVTSKDARYPTQKSGDQMVNLKNQNLNSMKTYPNSKSSVDQLPKIANTLNSKQLQSVQKILKDNEEYLKSNQFKAPNQHAFRKETGKQPYLFSIEDQESEANPNTLNIKNQLQRPWHQIVNDYQQEVEPIKTVQRNEKKINKDQEQREQKESQKERQKQRQQEIARQQQLQKQQQRERQKERERQRLKQKQKERQLRAKRQRQQLQKQKERQLQLQRQQQQRQREQAEKIRRMQKEKRQALRKQEEKAKRQAQQEAERQRILLLKEEEQRQRRNQFMRREAEKRLQEKQEMLRRQKSSQQSQIQMFKLNTMPSSYSRDDSDNKSEKSNKSGKKVKQKKQTTLMRDKTHKVYVRNQSPRAQESFYESSLQETQKVPEEQVLQKLKIQDKKPKLLTFSDDQIEMKPKSKTDMNFFDNTQSQKSIKPPSSKPPLSKRTNGSAGSVSKEKKPKQKTIAISIKEQSMKKVDQKKVKPEKKLTLMQKAMMKHNQSNDSCSEDSYRNRQNFSEDGSRRSNSSKNSRTSLKKQSTLNITYKDNAMIYSKYGKVPLQNKRSSSSHEEEMQQLERQRQLERSRERSMQKIREMKSHITNQRQVYSKNSTYIDSRGRIVNKDLMNRGKEVYGGPRIVNEDPNQYVLDRMKRSRDERRKRSKSRERNKLSRKLSRDGSQSGSCNDGSSYGSGSFYENNSNYPSNNNYGGSSYTAYPQNNSNPLRQFIRPVQQVPIYAREGQKNEVPSSQPSKATKTLNQMFYRKNTTPLSYNNSNMSQSRKSLGRTQKSLSKR